MRRLTRSVQSSNLVMADDITDGGDGDFTVEIVVEISPGIVLRSRLWMAVGSRGAWERSDGGDGEEKAVGPCSYAVEDLSEKSTSVDRMVEEEEEENERCEKKSMDR
ncbi:protein CLT3, chloroplastic [Fagus crenata]